MKRTRVAPETYCKVCRKEWTPRHLRTMRKQFDEMNPQRDPRSNSPLNADQVKHLLGLYFESTGRFKTLCLTHIKELASISNGTVQKLKESARRPVAWAAPWLNPNKPRRNYPPHRTTPPRVNALVQDFLKECSSTIPGREGFFLDARIRSYSDAYRVFKAQYLQPNQATLSLQTFVSRWKDLRPDVSLHSGYDCICGPCIKWERIQKEYREKERSIDEGAKMKPFQSCKFSLTLSRILQAQLRA